MERIITPDVVSVADFFGAKGININYLTSKFPLLKIVVRGSSIKLIGSEKEMDSYENRLSELIAYYKKYGHLSPKIIDSLVDSSPLKQNINHNSEYEKPEQEKNINEKIEGLILFGNNGNAIKACTPAQKQLVLDYKTNDMIFAIGPAGSGKTYTAIALAVRSLKNREVKKLILTRPAVEAGEKLGFLPGDMKDKLDPYLQPLYDALGDMMPRGKLNELMDEGVIQIAPLAYMRGRTLDNAVVILDESQNTTKEQLKMFLTRMGRNAKFLITGDMTQIDLPPTHSSGLKFAIEHLKNIEGISIIEFAARDIMRHPLVSRIVKAYDEKEE